MIVVKHPLERCNIEQEKRLQEVATDKRRWNELIFCYGNACYRYYQRSPEYNPSEEDFQEWLVGLQENLRKHMIEKGLEGVKGDLSFRRYVLEKNDVGLKEFVVGLMGEAEYRAYMRIVLNEKLGAKP